MFPRLWRYLLGQFFKILLLCLLAFIGILLTIRLEEIAYFASLTPQKKTFFLFVLYQIPYVLPIATPVSALIASYLLMQNLSETEELTALRAAGFSLPMIFTPLLLSACFLTVLNFYITSELATSSHLATNVIKQQIQSINPLLLLNHKHLMRTKGLYFDARGPSKLGVYAEDVVLAIPRKDGKTMSLILAKRMESSKNSFDIQGMTLITKGKKENQLFLENIGETSTSLQEFSQVMQPKTWTLNQDHLSMGLLLAGENRSDKVYSEIVRRISIALATFTFTLMGLTFGISSKRNPSYRGVVMVSCMGAFTLIAYFAAHSLEHNFFLAASLYLIPHAGIVLLAQIHLLSPKKKKLQKSFG